MRLRSLVTALAGTAAALAPAVAGAQSFPGYNRWYQATGCDYAFTDVFGAGPRLCATALVGVSDLGRMAIVSQANIVAYNWYRAGATESDPGLGFSPGTFGIDGGFTSCRFLACLGPVTEAGPIVDAFTTPGYVPQYLTMTVRYYDAMGAVDAGRVSSFRLEAVVTPEPATVVLLAGGLATLGVVSRGARRRRTRVES